MKYNLFGRTGLYVSELCLGTMTFGGDANSGIWAKIGQLQQNDVNAIVKRSLDAGINFIDTANVYSRGQSERLTGQALKDLAVKRDDVVIATKATGIMNEKPNGRGQSRYHLMNECEASLKRLQLDHIDLYQLHAVDPYTPIEVAVETMSDLVAQGKIRYWGLSNWAAWQIMKAQGVCALRGLKRPESVQSYYSIAGRDLEREVIPVTQDQQMGIMVWSPLAGGILSGKYNRDGSGPAGARRVDFDFPPINRDRAFNVIDAMRPIADKHRVSVAQVALGWLLHQKPVTTVIIGAKNTQQLDDNIKATSLKLDADDLVRLNEVSALPVEYPGWMIANQSAYRTQQWAAPK